MTKWGIIAVCVGGSSGCREDERWERLSFFPVLGFLGWGWLSLELIPALSLRCQMSSNVFFFRRIPLIHCSSVRGCLESTKCQPAGEWPYLLSTYIVTRQCELSFSLTFRTPSPKPDITNSKRSVLFAVPALGWRIIEIIALLICLYLPGFWKSYLLLNDGERMPINRYLGESQAE